MIHFDQADALKKINDNLPPTVRVFKMIPTSRGFNPKMGCDSRVYEYILPTYLLRAECDSQDEFEKKIASIDPEQVDYSQLEGMAPPSAEVLKEMEEYRSSKERIELLRGLLKRYEGTHSYHNFTDSKVKAGMQKANRYIISFTVTNSSLLINLVRRAIYSQ